MMKSMQQNTRKIGSGMLQSIIFSELGRRARSSLVLRVPGRFSESLQWRIVGEANHNEPTSLKWTK